MNNASILKHCFLIKILIRNICSYNSKVLNYRKTENSFERGRECGSERGSECGSERGSERGSECGSERGSKRGSERGREPLLSIRLKTTI